MKYLLVLFIGFVFFSCHYTVKEKPRVFVFTDININSGDPDDRQSLVHLFWYANEFKIEGIVPDRWNAKGYEACELAVDAYRKDYLAYNFKTKHYPDPEDLKRRIAKNEQQAIDLFLKSASKTKEPLYVLVWGNMQLFGKALLKQPSLAKNIRLITIGTGLMLEEHIQFMPSDWKRSKPCEQLNWNGFGRNEIYNDSQFNDMWWLEINWSYAGMFPGDEPKEMFEKLSVYGNLGKHLKELVESQPWAQYFRVGDTPSVLYLLDPNHDLNYPQTSSWAGRFVRPFPTERPNYYTDDCGNIEWDYKDPCNTWHNHSFVNEYAQSTLIEKREEMYTALLERLEGLYQQRK
ncbi:MAG: nucleoside hydrolase-like domain-containing protein [Prolixibacteraceae bacterium]